MALVICAEMGEHIGEPENMMTKTVRKSDSWVEGVAALTEAQSWFFDFLSHRNSGFVRLTCVRVDRKPLEDQQLSKGWEDDEMGLEITPTMRMQNTTRMLGLFSRAVRGMMGYLPGDSRELDECD